MPFNTAWTFEGLETAFWLSPVPLLSCNIGVNGEEIGAVSDESARSFLELEIPCNRKEITWLMSPNYHVSRKEKLCIKLAVHDSLYFVPSTNNKVKCSPQYQNAHYQWPNNLTHRNAPSTPSFKLHGKYQLVTPCLNNFFPLHKLLFLLFCFFL